MKWIISILYSFFFRFKFKFEIVVHSNDWTMVKLLPDNIALTLTHVALHHDSESSTGMYAFTVLSAVFH